MRIQLEVCVEDGDGVDAAMAGGADRIELCSALALGGLTPSRGLMMHASAASVPVYAMIRPREGDFVFSAAEVDLMRRDIDAALQAGLAGVVLGASTARHALNEAALSLLVAHAEGLGLTLHRAFDLVPDVEDAIAVAAGLGFERILTSGGRRTAPEGVDALERIIDLAAGRLSVMPGSGVTADSLPALLPRLALTELHASCSVAATPGDPRLADLGFERAGRRRTDVGTVRALKRALASLSSQAR